MRFRTVKYIRDTLLLVLALCAAGFVVSCLLKAYWYPAQAYCLVELSAGAVTISKEKTNGAGLKATYVGSQTTPTAESDEGLNSSNRNWANVDPAGDDFPFVTELNEGLDRAKEHPFPPPTQWSPAWPKLWPEFEDFRKQYFHLAYTVRVPLIWPVVMLVLITVPISRRVSCRGRNHGQGLSCEWCDYSRAGLPPESTCPECGIPGALKATASR